MIMGEAKAKREAIEQQVATHGPLEGTIHLEVYQDGHMNLSTNYGIKSLLMLLSKAIFVTSQQRLHVLAAPPVHLLGMADKADKTAGN